MGVFGRAGNGTRGLSGGEGTCILRKGGEFGLFRCSAKLDDG